MITALILAAGESKRMGQPKLLLPWGNGTVLSHVITVFYRAGLKDILVVTGAARDQVKDAISHLNVKTVHNTEYSRGEMLSSIQCGVSAMNSQTQAVLIGLGDQPQVRARSVRMVCDAYHETKSEIVVPSFKMRRGHPWLVIRPLAKDLMAMKSPQSPRDFLNVYHKEIHYVNVDDPGVLADLDTPDDYQKWRP